MECNLLFFFFSSSCFQVPGGSFPCLQKVCCKSEVHIRKGLSNRINKQVGLTSSCEPWVSVFSEAGGPFSYPRVSLSPPSFIALPSSWQRWRLCFRPHSWATTQVFFFFFPPLATWSQAAACSHFSTSALRHTRESKAVLAHDFHCWLTRTVCALKLIKPQDQTYQA